MSGHFGRQTASGHLTVPAESKAAYAVDVEERFRALFFAKPAPDCILRWSSTDVVRAD